MSTVQTISSLQNPRVKLAVRLRRRAHRNEEGLLLVEGYRELHRAIENGWRPEVVFYCPELYLGTNEPDLVSRCADAGAEMLSCTGQVLRKMAYRERPEGLLAIGPPCVRPLQEIRLSEHPLIVIAEAIEKPGNLGTMLRTADAAGADAVVVCDGCTDLGNPNVVRASIGTLFSVPVAESTYEETHGWLERHAIRPFAASPDADRLYYEANYKAGTAFIMGTEQVGLSDRWLSGADSRVRIPMLGQADSLNVAAATTILLYEAVRQRAEGMRATS